MSVISTICVPRQRLGGQDLTISAVRSTVHSLVTGAKVKTMSNTRNIITDQLTVLRGKTEASEVDGGGGERSEG